MWENSYVIRPKIKPIVVQGRLSYNENVRCNNILRFKKEIRNEFEDLQGRNGLIAYRMEYYRNEDELLERINQIIKSKIGLPFLLFLFREDFSNNEEW